MTRALNTPRVLQHSALQTNSDVAKRLFKGILGITSGSWERWWPSPRGGTSCWWTCPCSLEEPSSCLSRSLEPATREAAVSQQYKAGKPSTSCQLGKYLSPHLPDILKNHVAVTIKCPHAAKQLLVVPAVDKHLIRHKRAYIIRTMTDMQNSHHLFITENQVEEYNEGVCHKQKFQTTNFTSIDLPTESHQANRNIHNKTCSSYEAHHLTILFPP